MDQTPIILFAQARGAGGVDIFGGVMGLVCCAFEIVLFAVAIAFAIWYLMTIFKVLSEVSPRNRDMEPGMIFMVFIPFFGFVWHFFVVLRVASSLEKEYRSRGLRGDGDFGKTLGLWGLILPFTCLGAPGAPVCQVMYVLKLKNYTTELLSTSRRKSRDEDDDNDDDDDRPRRRRHRDDDE